MAEATLQVNAILDGVREAMDSDKNLSFIVIGGALALVSTEPGVASDAKPNVIWQALGLKD